MKWYPHDPSAALAGMIGLTVEERGAYYTLIDLLYARAPRSDVTDELIIKALAVRPQVWRRLKGNLMAKGKVHESDGRLIANRVEEELKLAANRMDKSPQTGGKLGSLPEVCNGVSGATSANINGLEGIRARATTITTSILESSLGKEAEAQPMQMHGNFRDKGPDYRAPPAAKSDNDLNPANRDDLKALAKRR